MAVFNEALLAVYVTTCGWVLMPSLAGGAQTCGSGGAVARVGGYAVVCGAVLGGPTSDTLVCVAA